VTVKSHFNLTLKLNFSKTKSDTNLILAVMKLA